MFEACITQTTMRYALARMEELGVQSWEAAVSSRLGLIRRYTLKHAALPHMVC